jgi:hypothetical protein
MSRSVPSVGPHLPALFALFRPGDDLPDYEIVPADEVPPPYDELLVHEHHMTVTVEKFYGSLVDVRVLDRKKTGDYYARKILLALQSTGQIVQFGIVRVNFRYCSPEVQAEIESERTPIGRVLIQHNVLRRIEPTAYFRVIPGAPMMGWFGLDRPRPTYGRLGYIHCDGKPCVELLEVMAPVPQK